MTPELRLAITNNLFPSARPAVEPWGQFKWHTDQQGRVHTWKTHSSQALAIDVFGTAVMALPSERDVFFNVLAASLLLPPDAGWQARLEWSDHATNHLRETRHTQVDALATSPRHLILVESKFTETGGPCSQTALMRGQRQCTGNYAMQSNPRNGRSSSCALSGKGIRYWDVIPEVFHLDATAEYLPCPFRGHWFQWMRNVALAHECAKAAQRTAAVAILYADHPRFPMPRAIASGDWQRFHSTLRQDRINCEAISYQSLLASVLVALRDAGLPTNRWQDLQRWVEDKIAQSALPRTDAQETEDR